VETKWENLWMKVIELWGGIMIQRGEQVFCGKWENNWEIWKICEFLKSQ
jgi:hypothetical protein